MKAVHAQNPDSQRRLRVLFAGLAISLIPPILLDTVAHNVLKIREETLPAWILLPCFSALALFPVTLAYVTVVQRALDVRVIVRQSLQYALAKRGVVVLQSFISLIVIVCVAVFSERAALSARILITAVGVGAVLFIGIGARWLAGWIDRKFFRDAYRTEQVLTRLADSARSIVELGPLLQTVVSRISEALHVSEVSVFLRGSGVYQPALAVGSQSPPIPFDENTALVNVLRSHKKPLPVYLEDRHSWVAALGEAEKASLRGLGAQMLLPLLRRDELLGFLSLGPKASEAPYSSTDLDLLGSVGSQVALAVENSRLTATIATEAAERQVILRELAIARDVQQRLFPQVHPPVPGIEYAATCRPAHEVGGDYYDFIELPGNALGVAIGDVSGKGVPAALLMANLQATLRGQTVSGDYNLDHLLCNINRAVYAASPANRYATFFYGHYRPDSRGLTYINAGHNAPILLRSSSNNQIIRLEAAAPPVGLFPGGEFQSAHIDLIEGDLLIFYTDGISEAMNNSEQEWGEDSLIEVAQKMGNVPPSVLLEEIFRAADEFTAGAPQHDDMTLIVFRFARPPHQNQII
jgi:sigma-B regulation protein RsbU (phosphoserine phosphatase)